MVVAEKDWDNELTKEELEEIGRAIKEVNNEGYVTIEITATDEEEFIRQFSKAIGRKENEM